MQNNQLIIVTCTYNRPGRLNLIHHLFNLILNTDNANDILWIVIDDNDIFDPSLKNIFEDYSNIICLNVGPTKDKGHAQRNLAYEYIVSNNINGIVYNADDDNYYTKEIFNEIRKIKKIGIMPVGNIKDINSPHIEKPIIQDNKITSWNSPWKDRKYPVDMAGFAFHSSLLSNLEKPYWFHNGLGGESEFISRICQSPDELEILCDNCSKCYAFHNQLYEKFDYLNEKCVEK